MLADVILPLALHGALTYRVPDDLVPRIRVGQLVIVPVKRKHYTAIVLRTYDGAADPKLRDVAGLVEPTPLITPDQLRLWRWMAQYYMCTPGEVAKAALPAGFKDEEKMSRRAAKVESDDQALLCAPLKALPEQLRHQLSPAQQRAAAAKGFINATDCADYLVKKGVAFRDAHKVVGELVAHCLNENKALLDLTLDELKQFHPAFEQDVFDDLSMISCVEKRKIPGAPAPEMVRSAIADARARL